jgi:hypothetical protein
MQPESRLGQALPSLVRSKSPLDKRATMGLVANAVDVFLVSEMSSWKYVGSNLVCCSIEVDDEGLNERSVELNGWISGVANLHGKLWWLFQGDQIFGEKRTYRRTSTVKLFVNKCIVFKESPQLVICSLRGRLFGRTINPRFKNDRGGHMSSEKFGELELQQRR